MSDEAEQRSAGLTGGKVLTATQSADGPYFAVQAIEDTVLDTGATVSEIESFATLAGKTIPAGVTLYGNFATVKVTTGTVICYKLNRNPAYG